MPLKKVYRILFASIYNGTAEAKKSSNLRCFLAPNYLAESGLQAIKNLEMRIPVGLGSIVFNDFNFLRLCSPTITAIAQPIHFIPKDIVMMVISRLNDNS